MTEIEVGGAVLRPCACPERQLDQMEEELLSLAAAAQQLLDRAVEMPYQGGHHAVPKFCIDDLERLVEHLRPRTEYAKARRREADEHFAPILSPTPVLSPPPVFSQRFEDLQIF